MRFSAAKRVVAVQMAGGGVTLSQAKQRRPLGAANRHRGDAAIGEPAGSVMVFRPLRIRFGGQPVARQADLGIDPTSTRV